MKQNKILSDGSFISFLSEKIVLWGQNYHFWGGKDGKMVLILKNIQFLWVKEAIFQFVPLLKPFQLFINPFNVKNQLKF